MEKWIIRCGFCDTPYIAVDQVTDFPLEGDQPRCYGCGKIITTFYKIKPAEDPDKES